MAAKKMAGRIAVDLSHLPKGIQDAVGTELAASIAKNLKLGKAPVVIGKLDPGIYGIVAPGLALQKFLKGLK